ncbi:C2 domain protein [Sesbania bispinosa]|nr:C2 domain protein [Sesbania bispinosa]
MGRQLWSGPWRRCWAHGSDEAVAKRRAEPYSSGRHDNAFGRRDNAHNANEGELHARWCGRGWG